MAGMALWSDGKIEGSLLFYKLAELISVPDNFFSKSIKSTDEFITRYKGNSTLIIQSR
jgi:hypothetical protein